MSDLDKILEGLYTARQKPKTEFKNYKTESIAEAKKAINAHLLQTLLELPSLKMERPDIQLSSNGYMTSGDGSARNTLRTHLIEEAKERLK